MNRKVLLIIVDGLGVSHKSEEERRLSDASFGNMPYLENLKKQYFFTELLAHGEAVGLPTIPTPDGLQGVMGNSEVGHLNIGAGQVVYQLSNIITHDLENILQGKPCEWNNKQMQEWLSGAKQKGYIHLIGLVSDGLVHSYDKHLFMLIDYFAKQKIKVYLHAFLDGRDVHYKSAESYLDKIGEIASISGRYYAMDRDNNLDRTQKAIEMLTNVHDGFLPDYKEVIKSSYDKGITDEFILPTALKGFKAIEKGDYIINFNFRADRARQLTEYFCCQNKGNYNYLGFAKYTKNDCCKYIYSNPKIENCLSELVAKNNLTQIKIAETEKYAHVTYFFNAQNREPYKNEKWILVDSKKIATYDLEPRMSAGEITEEVDKAIEDGIDFVVVNYANCDMVGHTGNLEASREACGFIDYMLLLNVMQALKKGYTIIITSDHGNVEEMCSKNGEPLTQHTTNKVPFIFINSKKTNKKLATYLMSLEKISDISKIVLFELGIK